VSGARRLRRASLGALAAALGAAALGALALAPADPGGSSVLFVVEPGASLGSVASELAAQGLVRSARALEWLGRWRGASGELRAGEYELSPALAAPEVLERLVEGRVRTYPVVIPEGLNAAEVAARLAEAGLADAEAFEGVARGPELPALLGVEGSSLEGYLFPETYAFARGLPPRQIAEVMVRQFLALWAELEPLARAQGRSMKEVVTLASMVEKETGAGDERPLIASVFLNRLARGMRLESDPTTIYGIPGFDGNLRRNHLEDPSNRYNTYRIAALPPGPIANPGRAALRAVLEPSRSEYLYFVSRNDGTHQFSRTYPEHQRAVDRYQRSR
jgi:UPF0755 protein